MISSIQRVILRSALRIARKLDISQSALYLQSVPQPSDFQSHAVYASLESFLHRAELSLPQTYKSLITSRLIAGSLLRSYIHQVARNAAYRSESEDDEFKALRFLNEQVSSPDPLPMPMPMPDHLPDPDPDPLPGHVLDPLPDPVTY
jgi:hypothetical protein